MKRAPAPRPDWIEICAIDARLRERHRLPDDPGPGLAAVGRQPRLHRSQSLVRALRRRRPARLPALRSRSRCRGRPSQACARRRCWCATGAQALGMPPIAEDDRLERDPRLRAIVRGPTQKEVWRFAKASRSPSRRSGPTLDHRRLPRRQSAARPRAGRLQPERLGPHAGLGLLAAPPAARAGLDAGHLGRARRRRAHRGFRRCATCRACRRARRSLGAAPRCERGRFDLAPLLRSIG